MDRETLKAVFADADADGQRRLGAPVVGVDRLLDGDGRRHSFGRAPEGRHHAVAERLDQGTTMGDHGLLDELHIWLHPLLVGNSDPSDQIGAVGAQCRFQLTDVRRFDSGLVILRYHKPDTN